MSAPQRGRRWPAMVRRQVFDRDRGVCAGCGLDTEALRRELMELDAEARRLRESELMWPSHRMDYWDADHIVPFADGGPCDLENMRTLCLPCHAGVTVDYLQRRGSAQRPSSRPSKRPPTWSDPGADGGWWISDKPQRIECPRCDRAFDDYPGVMRYVARLDHDGIQGRHQGEWSAKGWAVWRQCEFCSWTDWRTEHVTIEEIRAWNVGPWKPMS